MSRNPELGTGATWIHDENWTIPVLHFGSPPPVVAKKAKKKLKLSEGEYIVSKEKMNKFAKGGHVGANEKVEATFHPDVVREPEHYRSHPSGIEVIEIIRHESFLRGNVLKHILRAPYKGTELQDLEKAQVYLEWEIERVKKLNGSI